ncbi:aldo/keto reductase [Pseudogemmobacter faecipullorum]|uniref:Aldo/keto reductase n=1 Tax=Pseudogemmobacter faecipullorum TaxID=2755041 RepID=A0ABS8CH53_9RHOB|nr:aldo/keto reductase [Pseudogemmobacter faecipullorum]MCB5408704.1 aldo/keto reductase [Pseudogemmobacter faecipullorum]
MQKRYLGQHEVGAIGLGAMSLGGMYGPTDEAESFATLDAAREAGISHIDIANIYGMGRSEAVVGAWLKARRIAPGQGVVLATKAAIIPGPPRQINNEAAYLRAELEASLKRLGRDHIELFYLHRREAERPVEEVAGSMQRLVEEGKIGGYGLSEVSPATLRRAHAVHPVMAVQNEYSLWTRLPELGLISACAELGVSFVAFSPLGRGIFGDQPLARPMDPFRSQNPRFSAVNLPENLAAVARFRAFALARGYSCPALALAWILHQAPHLLPIPGTRAALHLRSWGKAEQIRLGAADLAEIAQILPAGFAAGARYAASQRTGVESYC